MESSSQFIVPDVLANSWSDITLLSERRHAVLYRAKRLERYYILKCLPAELATITDYRLQQEREFRMGVSLHHPGIVETYSLEDVADLGRCLVIEYVDGCTLAEWLRKKPSYASRLRLWRQLEDVASYLRSRQMEHHDLKADNLMVTSDGQYIKLIDFGLSGIPEGRSDVQDMLALKRQMFPLVIQRLAVDHARMLRLLPMLLSVLLFVGMALFYWQFTEERQAREKLEAEKCHEEDVVKETKRLLACEVAEWQRIVDSSANSNHAFLALCDAVAASGAVRDSLMSLFPDTHPMHYVILDIWTVGATAEQARLIEECSRK